MTITETTQAVEALRERLGGALLAPGEGGFDEATRLWNGLIEKTPALVVQPTGSAAVAATVDFARDHGLALWRAVAATTSPAPPWPTAA
jgi:hypothetical protein